MSYKFSFLPTAAIILFFLALSVFAQADNKLDVLNTFVGKWEGKATAFFPRDDDRPNRTEEVTVECRKLLKDTYIECSSVWTQPNGDYRELMTYWNYDRRSDKYEILFLYDNWPGKVNYQLEYDPETRTFTGHDTFTASGGVAAKEKVEWHISEDGNTITSTEFNQYETDPEDYWAKSFEFVWKCITN